MSNVITAVSNDNIKSQDDIEKAAVPAPKKQRDKLVEHVEPEADYSMRIAVLGDSGVGKTSLVLKELGRTRSCVISSANACMIILIMPLAAPSHSVPDELHALDNPVRSIGITFRVRRPVDVCEETPPACRICHSPRPIIWTDIRTTYNTGTLPAWPCTSNTQRGKWVECTRHMRRERNAVWNDRNHPADFAQAPLEPSSCST